MTNEKAFDIEFPLIIEINGVSTKKFTENMYKPCDTIFSNAMVDLLMIICAWIPGCLFGYSFSDKIYLLISNDDAGFFKKNGLIRAANIISSVATLKFNTVYEEDVYEFFNSEENEAHYESCQFYESQFGEMIFSAAIASVAENHVLEFFNLKQKECKSQFEIEFNGGVREIYKDVPNYIKNGILCEQKEVNMELKGLKRKSMRWILNYNVDKFLF